MLANARDVAGIQSEQSAHANEAEAESESASRHGEQNTLGKQLSNDARAPGTHRRPDGEFTLASCSADEKQIGDVRARNKKN
jgi:hypothetical protein